ncbi:hypothetical protein D9M68_652440 [compost metagenome]
MVAKASVYHLPQTAMMCFSSANAFPAETAALLKSNSVFKRIKASFLTCLTVFMAVFSSAVTKV